MRPSISIFQTLDLYGVYFFSTSLHLADCFHGTPYTWVLRLFFSLRVFYLLCIGCAACVVWDLNDRDVEGMEFTRLLYGVLNYRCCFTVLLWGWSLLITLEKQADCCRLCLSSLKLCIL
jgi:hypothetical protein